MEAEGSSVAGDKPGGGRGDHRKQRLSLIAGGYKAERKKATPAKTKGRSRRASNGGNRYDIAGLHRDRPQRGDEANALSSDSNSSDSDIDDNSGGTPKSKAADESKAERRSSLSAASGMVPRLSSPGLTAAAASNAESAHSLALTDLIGLAPESKASTASSTSSSVLNHNDGGGAVFSAMSNPMLSRRPSLIPAPVASEYKRLSLAGDELSVAAAVNAAASAASRSGASEVSMARSPHEELLRSVSPIPTSSSESGSLLMTMMRSRLSPYSTASAPASNLHLLPPPTYATADAAAPASSIDPALLQQLLSSEEGRAQLAQALTKLNLLPTGAMVAPSAAAAGGSLASTASSNGGAGDFVHGPASAIATNAPLGPTTSTSSRAVPALSQQQLYRQWPLVMPQRASHVQNQQHAARASHDSRGGSAAAASGNRSAAAVVPLLSAHTSNNGSAANALTSVAAIASSSSANAHLVPTPPPTARRRRGTAAGEGSQAGPLQQQQQQQQQQHDAPVPATTTTSAVGGRGASPTRSPHAIPRPVPLLPLPHHRHHSHHQHYRMRNSDDALCTASRSPGRRISGSLHSSRGASLSRASSVGSFALAGAGMQTPRKRPAGTSAPVVPLPMVRALPAAEDEEAAPRLASSNWWTSNFSGGSSRNGDFLSQRLPGLSPTSAAAAAASAAIDGSSHKTRHMPASPIPRLNATSSSATGSASSSAVGLSSTDGYTPSLMEAIESPSGDNGASAGGKAGDDDYKGSIAAGSQQQHVLNSADASADDVSRQKPPKGAAVAWPMDANTTAAAGSSKGLHYDASERNMTAPSEAAVDNSSTAPHSPLSERIEERRNSDSAVVPTDDDPDDFLPARPPQLRVHRYLNSNSSTPHATSAGASGRHSLLSATRLVPISSGGSNAPPNLRAAGSGAPQLAQDARQPTQQRLSARPAREGRAFSSTTTTTITPPWSSSSYSAQRVQRRPSPTKRPDAQSASLFSSSSSSSAEQAVAFGFIEGARMARATRAAATTTAAAPAVGGGDDTATPAASSAGNNALPESSQQQQQSALETPRKGGKQQQQLGSTHGTPGSSNGTLAPNAAARTVAVATTTATYTVDLLALDDYGDEDGGDYAPGLRGDDDDVDLPVHTSRINLSPFKSPVRPAAAGAPAAKQRWLKR